ncbi:hypothetical protein PNIG_a2730 [Pseudoalteromonas nigrifaciens]|uniref:Uncharacterized protein n=1 Tax=Pseudoalteromonas nigrifaciens TaxID=28109 RepID=A0AAC9UGD7_9GAMM|nr:hypothetical protein PNIG_a2730 [Pseudoalteromonas nigrifaciens]GEN44121.1 hypothetical protein PNI02_35870 [Pseudoalteromonas nigrifaciens]SJN19129.1 hypothetical protein CZ797_01625 [Pseudoalteromonas sp. JB197]
MFLSHKGLNFIKTPKDDFVCKEGEQSPKLKIEVNHASFC